jgi:hypothetical protein
LIDALAHFLCIAIQRERRAPYHAVIRQEVFRELKTRRAESYLRDGIFMMQ